MFMACRDKATPERVTKSRLLVWCILTYVPNGNNSLSPPKRGEGWGEGFKTVNIGSHPGLLLLEGGEGEKIWRVFFTDTGRCNFYP